MKSILCVLVLVAMFRNTNGAETKYATAITSGTTEEADRALSGIEDERKNLISALIAKLKLVEGSKSGEEFRNLEEMEHLRCSLLALGKMKAVEALDVLVDWLEFTGVPDDEDIRKGLSKRFPASRALIMIGPCCIDYLLTSVAERKMSRASRGQIGFVIKTLLGIDGEHRIRAFAARIDDKAKQDLLLSKEILVYYDQK